MDRNQYRQQTLAERARWIAEARAHPEPPPEMSCLPSRYLELDPEEVRQRLRSPLLLRLAGDPNLRKRYFQHRLQARRKAEAQEEARYPPPRPDIKHLYSNALRMARLARLEAQANVR